MSHFDDIEPVLYTDGSGCGPIGGGVFLIIAVGAIWWAYHQDGLSKRACAEHGENYVDSREGYTLCEQDGGTVVRR